ncbi:MAG: DNA starvation/stationary phase protection protein [Pseudomonadota bacterium]
MSTQASVAIGGAREDRRELAALLGKALASTYVLYHKTHAYHWNVTGPLFYSVHKLTDEQYQNLADAVDEIAERIRALGFATPVGLSSYMSNSIVDDVKGAPPAAEMLRVLAEDHRAVAAQFTDIVEIAEKHDDVYTADMLTARIGFHEEAAWMLNAQLAEGEDALLTA